VQTLLSRRDAVLEALNDGRDESVAAELTATGSLVPLPGCAPHDGDSEAAGKWHCRTHQPHLARH